MKTQKLWKRFVGAALLAALLASVCACGRGQHSIVNTSSTKLSDSTTDLMKDVKAVSHKPRAEVSKGFEWEYRSFAFTLFQQTAFQEALKSQNQDKTFLISPLSVMSALAMTLNGADGETAAQMRRALVEGYQLDALLPVDDLNAELGAFVRSLPSGDKAKLSMANSLWLREGAIQPKDAFLQTNADYYNAGVYSAKFDQNTLQDINQWVSRHTDGMIDKLPDDISDDTVMYLINALAFDAEWQDIYSEDEIRQGEFHGTTGNQTVDMMHSMEVGWLRDDKATGFIKPYASGYSFVAMLPNEDVSIDEYIGSWSDIAFMTALENVDDREVSVNLPKFKAEYETELNAALRAMGMADAFDPEQADFSRMGETAGGDNLYISEVKHKTFISVDERGTKAGAATSVGMDTGSAIMIPTVYLDRPFVYLIIENESRLPVFMGAVMNVQ